MYVLLFCFIFLVECFAQDAVSKFSQHKRAIPSLQTIIEYNLLHYHCELEAEGEKADETFENYIKLCEQHEVAPRIKTLLARCLITSHNVEAINTFNKNAPTHKYPQLAYDVFLNQKLSSENKKAIIIFMRNYPEEKLVGKPYQILDALIKYYTPITHYFNNRLLFACQNSIEPCIFNFLLKKGDQPFELVIWHLIGNQKPVPEIHENMLGKLEYLTGCTVNISPTPPNPFIPSTNLKPLEYAESMLACWSDQEWTRGFYEKRFEQFKNFSLILNEIISPETIEKYINFYTRVVELLKKSKNIMPGTELQTQ